MEKLFFKLFILVSAGLLGFMLLSIYNMSVIDKQVKTIRLLQKSCH